MTTAMERALEDLEAMAAPRPRTNVARRIHSEVAADHGVPVKTVRFLHQALMTGWQPSSTHPWRKVAVDLAWHRHRGTIQ